MAVKSCGNAGSPCIAMAYVASAGAGAGDDAERIDAKATPCAVRRTIRAARFRLAAILMGMRRRRSSSAIRRRLILTVTEYAAPLYLVIKVSYRDGSCRVAVSRCCRILRRWTGVGGCVRTSRAGKCQQADAQIGGTSICSGTLRGIDRMTYWTAPAAWGPATRMAAAMTATPAAFVKTLALCASLTAAGALVASAPAFAQQPDAAAPAAPKPKKPKPKPPAAAAEP